jgi:hypothetical protein
MHPSRMYNLCLMEENLRNAVNSILEQIGHASLERLFFTPIQPLELNEYLARLSYHVSPSYLPFMTDSSGTMVVYLQPGRPIDQSPILYVGHDAQEARFVCDRLATLPAALWLWVCTYFREKPDVLRDVTATMTLSIPGGRAVPEALWAFIDHDPVRWSPRSRHANRAWELAEVGHPFAGAPDIEIAMPAQTVISLLEPFVAARREVPELVATLRDCRSKAGLPVSDEEVLTIFAAEGWRDLSTRFRGRWRRGGQGMGEWDCTLRHLEGPQRVLQNTPFAALIGHPATYSGEDRDGHRRLIEVASVFRQNGDREAELRQLRNAATIALFARGEYPADLAMAIAEVCDAITSDSLAATVARESARLHGHGP